MIGFVVRVDPQEEDSSALAAALCKSLAIQPRANSFQGLPCVCVWLGQDLIVKADLDS